MTDPVPSKDLVKNLRSWSDPDTVALLAAAADEIERLEQCHREGWNYAREVEDEYKRRTGNNFADRPVPEPSKDVCSQLRALTGGNRLLGYAAAEEIESLRAIVDVWERDRAAPEPAVCPTCQGNDMDMPCAYPSESKPGCLRDKGLAREPRAHRLDRLGDCKDCTFPSAGNMDADNCPSQPPRDGQ